MPNRAEKVSWQRLKKDRRFILRRAETVDSLALEARSKIAAAKKTFRDDPIRLRIAVRAILLDRLDRDCRAIYSTAKHVWNSRGRSFTPEFCSSVFQEGILPHIEQNGRLDRGFLRNLKSFGANGVELSEPLRRALEMEHSRALDEIRGRIRMLVETDIADLEPLPNPTIDDIKEALERDDREEAVRLYRQIQAARNQPSSQVALYEKARIDSSDYYKWLRKKGKTSPTFDQRMRKTLTDL